MLAAADAVLDPPHIFPLRLEKNLCGIVVGVEEESREDRPSAIVNEGAILPLFAVDCSVLHNEFPFESLTKGFNERILTFDADLKLPHHTQILAQPSH